VHRKTTVNDVWPILDCNTTTTTKFRLHFKLFPLWQANPVTRWL